MDNHLLKLPYERTIQVKTDLNALTQVLTWFEQFNQPPVPPSDWLECQLALAEAFTNAVRHAHIYKPPETPIDIEVVVYVQTIELRVWDYGSGFDLEQLSQYSSDEPDYRENGRGLNIMQKVASELSYRQVGQRNCLQLIKRFSSS